MLSRLYDSKPCYKKETEKKPKVLSSCKVCVWPTALELIFFKLLSVLVLSLIIVETVLYSYCI